MICVSVDQTSGGRTGHKMKDYLTAYCVHFMFGWPIVYNKTWNFPVNDHNNHVNMFNIRDTTLSKDCKNPKNKVYNFQAYSGMELKKLLEIKENAEKYKEDVIVTFKNATRLLPNQLYNWGYKKEYNNLIFHLKHLYDISTFKPKNNIKSTVFTVTVHIRKGDVFNKIIHNFDHRDITYYVNVIQNISKLIEEPFVINIISEKWKGYDEKDVRDLMNLKIENNIKINVVLENCIYEYFTDFIESDILVLTNGQGSFSDMGFIYSKPSSKIVLCSDYRHFDYIDDLNKKIIFTDKNGKLLI
jgi:hypothetical protein